MTFGVPVDPEVKSTFPKVSVERILPKERKVSEGSTNLSSVRICTFCHSQALRGHMHCIICRLGVEGHISWTKLRPFRADMSYTSPELLITIDGKSFKIL